LSDNNIASFELTSNGKFSANSANVEWYSYDDAPTLYFYDADDRPHSVNVDPDKVVALAALIVEVQAARRAKDVEEERKKLADAVTAARDDYDRALADRRVALNAYGEQSDRYYAALDTLSDAQIALSSFNDDNPPADTDGGSPAWKPLPGGCDDETCTDYSHFK
jgi:hypothetical protein